MLIKSAIASFQIMTFAHAFKNKIPVYSRKIETVHVYSFQYNNSDWYFLSTKGSGTWEKPADSCAHSIVCGRWYYVQNRLRMEWVLQTAAPRGDREKPIIVLQLYYTSCRSGVSPGSSQLQLKGPWGQMGNGVQSRGGLFHTWDCWGKPPGDNIRSKTLLYGLY